MCVCHYLNESFKGLQTQLYPNAPSQTPYMYNNESSFW